MTLILVQKTQKRTLWMPTLQQQAPHFSGPHPICCQITLPGTCSHEHCSAHVHRPVWCIDSIDALQSEGQTPASAKPGLHPENFLQDRPTSDDTHSAFSRRTAFDPSLFLHKFHEFLHLYHFWPAYAEETRLFLRLPFPSIATFGGCYLLLILKICRRDTSLAKKSKVISPFDSSVGRFYLLSGAERGEEICGQYWSNPDL